MLALLETKITDLLGKLLLEDTDKSYLNLLLKNIGKNATNLIEMKPEGPSNMRRSHLVKLPNSLLYILIFQSIYMAHISFLS